MNAPTRLVAFGIAAVLVLGGGAVVGAAFGPHPSPSPEVQSEPAADHPHADAEGHS